MVNKTAIKSSALLEVLSSFVSPRCCWRMFFFFLVKILYAWNYALFTAMLPQEALVVWVHGRSRLAVEHLCKVFRVLNSTIHTPSWRGVFISPQLFTRQKRIVGDYVDQYHYH